MKSILSGATVGHAMTVIIFTIAGQANVGTFIIGLPICIGWMAWAWTTRDPSQPTAAIAAEEKMA